MAWVARTAIIMSELSAAVRTQQVLLNWFSPSFPIGSFHFSHGLETAIDEGLVTEADSLGEWLDVVIETGSGWNDAVLLSLVLRSAHPTSELNDYALALSSGRERYEETRQLGRAFTQSVRATHGLVMPDDLAYPIAVGLAARQLDLVPEAVVPGYLQAFLHNLVMVAVKHMPLGQKAGQHVLNSRFPLLATCAERALQATLDDLGGHAFAADIVSLRHEHQEVRIYNT